MHPKNPYEPTCLVNRSLVRQGSLPFAMPPHEVTLQLTRRAAMSVVLVLSIGLWAAIWAALASLASATLG